MDDPYARGSLRWLLWTSHGKLRNALVDVVGIVLNCFAFRVWSSRTMRGTSLAVYLRALSLSDMGALIFTYFLGYWRSHHAAFNTLFLVRCPLIGFITSGHILTASSFLPGRPTSRCAACTRSSCPCSR